TALGAGQRPGRDLGAAVGAYEVDGRGTVGVRHDVKLGIGNGTPGHESPAGWIITSGKRAFAAPCATLRKVQCGGPDAGTPPLRNRRHSFLVSAPFPTPDSGLKRGHLAKFSISPKTEKTIPEGHHDRPESRQRTLPRLA